MSVSYEGCKKRREILTDDLKIDSLLVLILFVLFASSLSQFSFARGLAWPNFFAFSLMSVLNGVSASKKMTSGVELKATKHFMGRRYGRTITQSKPGPGFTRHLRHEARRHETHKNAMYLSPSPKEMKKPRAHAKNV